MASPDNSSVREKAAECFLSLEIGTTDRLTRLRWRAWLAESAEHRDAFQACRETWNAAAGAKTEQPGNAELSLDGYDGEVPVAAIRRGRLGLAQPDDMRRVPLSRGTWMALAASLVLAAVVAIRHHPTAVQPPTPAAVAYETGRGEQRQLTLSDGSVIMMGPEVHLEVELLPTQRIFRLTSGEAIFTAAHDAARPFRVYAGPGWIDDIGTAFDVRSDPAQVTVTVIQGEVEVGTAHQDHADPKPVRLTRNEQISFGDTRGPVRTVDARQTTAWRDGQLAYIDQPLANVVDDLKRYSMKDIVMPDPSVGALHYTGTVSIGELDHWAAGLARVYPVQIQIQGDRLLISAKRKDR
jgi:transmembrane sensor